MLPNPQTSSRNRVNNLPGLIPEDLLGEVVLLLGGDA